MFKHFILPIVIVFITYPAKAQNIKPYRYKDSIFSTVTVDKDLSYNLNDSSVSKKSRLFDIYMPAGDTTTKRPLIIWMHGGGFKFGSKEAKGIQLWCKSFARRGYVCAAINYTLSKKDPLFHFGELQKSCYYAVQDAKMAVAYFKLHHSKYGIDPDKIILAGNSAGSLMALQAAYSTDDELAKMAGITDTATMQQGVLKVAAVINFWGAIFDLNWLKNARVPIVSVLGSEDGVIPPTHKSAPLYGGLDIHKQADSLSIPNALKVFQGYSHELQKHFNPFFSGDKATQNRWMEAGHFAADFLYNSLFK
ncbi:MAG TPA: alpha/beta hydrolase [Mucilaginibacter sp.]|jgi:poly(3-hydroxybutyrate) depolymerase